MTLSSILARLEIMWSWKRPRGKHTWRQKTWKLWEARWKSDRRGRNPQKRTAEVCGRLNQGQTSWDWEGEEFCCFYKSCPPENGVTDVFFSDPGFNSVRQHCFTDQTATVLFQKRASVSVNWRNLLLNTSERRVLSQKRSTCLPAAHSSHHVCCVFSAGWKTPYPALNRFFSVKPILADILLFQTLEQKLLCVLLHFFWPRWKSSLIHCVLLRLCNTAVIIVPLVFRDRLCAGAFMDTVAALAAFIAFFYYLRIARRLSQFHNSKLFCVLRRIWKDPGTASWSSQIKQWLWN